MRFYKSLGEPYISSFACYLGEDYRARCGVPDFSALINFVKKSGHERVTTDGAI